MRGAAGDERCLQQRPAVSLAVRVAGQCRQRAAPGDLLGGTRANVNLVSAEHAPLREASVALATHSPDGVLEVVNRFGGAAPRRGRKPAAPLPLSTSFLKPGSAFGRLRSGPDRPFRHLTIRRSTAWRPPLTCRSGTPSCYAISTRGICATCAVHLRAGAARLRNAARAAWRSASGHCAPWPSNASAASPRPPRPPAAPERRWHTTLVPPRRARRITTAQCTEKGRRGHPRGPSRSPRTTNYELRTTTSHEPTNHRITHRPPATNQNLAPGLLDEQHLAVRRQRPQLVRRQHLDLRRRSSRSFSIAGTTLSRMYFACFSGDAAAVLEQAAEQRRSAP